MTFIKRLISNIFLKQKILIFPLKLKNYFGVVILFCTLISTTSCITGAVMGGGFMNGTRVKQSVNNNSSIIFGKIEVYDQSNNLSPDKNLDISESCVIFNGDDPLYSKSLFYRYNKPEVGQVSNIHNGLFAFQINEGDLKDVKELNLACGTRHYLEKQIKFFSFLLRLDYKFYLKMDLKRPININSFQGKAFYLGDIKVSLPVDANIVQNKATFMKSFFGSNYSRYYIDGRIDASSFVKDNFKKTSDDISKLLPFLTKDFVFEKAVAY